MYNSKQFRIFIEHIKSGVSDSEIASQMGRSRKTIYNWKRRLIKSLEQNEELELGILLESFNDLLANNKMFRDRVKIARDIGVSDLRQIGQSALENSQAMANIVKSLGIGRCKGLLNEISELEEKLENAKKIIQLMLLNNIDLKEGLKEPNPDANERAKIICS